MSQNFMTGMHNALNVAQTENGATAFATTNSALLDLFAQGGALRARNEAEAQLLFTTAFGEDQLLATRAMFYFRDARGGQGERNTFRKQLKWMANAHADIVRKNIKLIPYFGRWDDLYVLFDTPLEGDAIATFARQLMEDVDAERPSLLAKWLKSENTSSQESRRLARKTREGLGLSSKAYRKMLSELREKINVVERLVSANQWTDVNYEHVPSQANIKYGRAFLKHDTVRRREFLGSLTKGEAKINASVLFPYEVVRKVREGNMGYGVTMSEQDIALYDALWKALPDYIGDKQENAIAVVDVSGSMESSNNGLPMDVALSVGMYLAERNTHPAFHNKFITFSSVPELVDIVGSNIAEKILNMKEAKWKMNTDIHAVFRLVLDVAKRNGLTQEELPHKLYIISDMEFDNASSCNSPSSYASRGYADHYCSTNVPVPDEKLFQTIAREFQEAGYTMPNLVFWNVDARNEQFPMSMDGRGFQMVSGCSPSIFKYTMGSEFLSAYDMMLEVLNSDRYAVISV